MGQRRLLFQMIFFVLVFISTANGLCQSVSASSFSDEVNGGADIGVIPDVVLFTNLRGAKRIHLESLMKQKGGVNEFLVRFKLQKDQIIDPVHFLHYGTYPTERFNFHRISESLLSVCQFYKTKSLIDVRPDIIEDLIELIGPEYGKALSVIAEHKDFDRDSDFTTSLFYECGQAIQLELERKNIQSDASQFKKVFQSSDQRFSLRNKQGQTRVYLLLSDCARCYEIK